MVEAIQFDKPGGPEVLVYRSMGELSPPAPGEVRLRHTAIGLNYIDTYHRSGLYPVALPSGLGTEAAGVVEAVGAGAALAVGDRVVYARGPIGAYTTHRNVPASMCLPLPEAVSDTIAASALLKGLTAWYLVRRTFPLREGETILVHAAAGGVGLILCQWAKSIGARVIGTVGSPEKVEIARAHGCDEVILSRTEDVAARVRALTRGVGVPVVYDGVGKATFTASLDALRPLGLLVSYGNASGAVPAVDLRELSKRGSLYITRPSLMDYVADDVTYRHAAQSVINKIATGGLTIKPPHTFALKDAADAHRALEGRYTTGSTVLIP